MDKHRGVSKVNDADADADSNEFNLLGTYLGHVRNDKREIHEINFAHDEFHVQNEKEKSISRIMHYIVQCTECNVYSVQHQM